MCIAFGVFGVNLVYSFSESFGGLCAWDCFSVSAILGLFAICFALVREDI